MRLILTCLAVAFLSSPILAVAQARLMRVIPANPVALEIVHVELEVNICYRVRGVELIENGLRVLLHGDDRNAYCDYDNNYRVALGAFAPGTYRVETKQTLVYSPAVVIEEVGQFVVLPGPASTIANDDLPREDLSGIWTSPTQPSTGLFLVHSFGALAPSPDGPRPVESVTGFWAVFDSPGAPIWYVLAMDRSFTTGRFEGTAVRYAASGAETSRVVTPSTVGAATFDPMSSRKHMSVTLGGEELEFDIEPLRWTRAAWPGRAPTGF